jgi:hypothetical protein
MTGVALDWSNLLPAAAFVLGAILATIGTLRVVRAVAVMFGGELRRGRRRPDGDPPAP